MLVAEIEATWIAGMRVVRKADTALGLNDNVFAGDAQRAHRLRKNLLRLSEGIDVGVIEEVDTLLKRRSDDVNGCFALVGGHRLAIPPPANAHAAVCDARDLEIGMRNLVDVHCCLLAD